MDYAFDFHGHLVGSGTFIQNQDTINNGSGSVNRVNQSFKRPFSLEQIHNKLIPTILNHRLLKTDMKLDTNDFHNAVESILCKYKKEVNARQFLLNEQVSLCDFFVLEYLFQLGLDVKDEIGQKERYIKALKILSECE